MSMTTDQAKLELKRLFDAYPSYRDYLAGVSDRQATAAAWQRMLTMCDASDVADVVDDMIAGKLEPTGRYESKDQVVPNIRSHANQRRSERVDKQRQFQKYHKPVRDARRRRSEFGMTIHDRLDQAMGDDDKRRIAAHTAIDMGNAVARGELTRDENDRRLDEMLEWAFRAGLEPEWLGVHTEAEVCES